MAEYYKRVVIEEPKLLRYQADTEDIPDAYVRYEPAADVVEVIRCKDCKYRGWVQEPCHGKTVHYCKLTENRVEDNNFCSYGERRSE